MNQTFSLRPIDLGMLGSAGVFALYLPVMRTFRAQPTRLMQQAGFEALLQIPIKLVIEQFPSPPSPLPLSRLDAWIAVLRERGDHATGFPP
jgi:hypothetical protein